MWSKCGLTAKKGGKIMDFLGNVKKMVTDTTQTVVKKSGEVLETTKIKYGIFNLKNDIDLIYKEIGKEIYNKFETGDDVFDSVNSKCELIREKNKEIAQMEKEIANVKNIVYCANCENVCDKQMEFCPKCGGKLDNKDFGDKNEDKVFEAGVIE